MDRADVLVYNGKLHHITTDHFLVVGYDNSEPDDPLYVAMEFKVGIDGSVQQLGIPLEEAMKGEKIWFTRV